MITRVLCWCAGWRVDLDGGIVRARKADDPDFSSRSDLGFSEDACIAVRSWEIARRVDRGDFRGTCDTKIDGGDYDR